MTAQNDPGRPTTGVFLIPDEEDVTVERRGAGTRHDRTVVTARHMVKRYELWSNAITDDLVASAESYARSDSSDDRIVRVEVFDGKNGNIRR